MLKLISILVAILIGPKSYSEILLIPDSDVSFSDYKTICEKNEYSCFPKAYSKIANRIHSQFDSFLEKFNTNDLNYVKYLDSNISDILKNENISADEFDQLIFAVEKLKSRYSAQKKINEVLTKILFIKKQFMLLTHELQSDRQSYIYVLQTFVDNTEYNRQILNSTFKDVLHKTVNFNSVSSEPNLTSSWVTGTCEKPVFSDELNNFSLEQKIPLFKNGCSLNEKFEWGSDLVGHHFKKNTKNYLWGVGLLVGLILLQNHDFIFEY